MQLFFEPVGDVRKHFGFVRLHQQFMAGAGVEFRLDVPDTGVPEALDGPHDFLIPDNEELQDKTVAILTKALARRRLIAFGGVFKEIHQKLNLDDVEDGDLVNTDNEDLREGVRYYKEIVMWNFGYSNYYINEIKLPEEEQR
mgnify:CR=1 FL=1